jgi:xyloglucan-specific endo-beta-1,4-glucanase
MTTQSINRDLKTLNVFIRSQFTINRFFKLPAESPTYDVEAYPEVLMDSKYSGTHLPRTISSVTTIPSTWNYSLSEGDSTGYDVAYDAWVYPNSGATGTATAEIMVWTAANFGQDGTNVGDYTIDGITFTLYQSLPADYSWTNHPVYSFVAQKSVSYISGDFKQFITALTNKGYFSTSGYLTSVEAGIELRGTSGSGSLTTYDFNTYVGRRQRSSIC